MRWHDAPPLVSSIDGDTVAELPIRFSGILHPPARALRHTQPPEPGQPAEFEVYSVEVSTDGEHWSALPDLLLTPALYETLARIGVDAETGVVEHECAERADA